MNDAEVKLEVIPNDGGGFVKLGGNLKKCDRQAEFLKMRIDDVSSSIEKMEKAQSKFSGFAGGTMNFNQMLANAKKFKLQQDSLFSKPTTISSNLFNGVNLQKASFNATPIIEQRAQLEKLQNQYNKLGVVSSTATKSMNTGFGIASKNVGRFIFNMFALGSVFALVARAGRSVMESDESYRASTELTANALGQILAPAMKTIVNLTQYAVIGIAELVRLFTGYNALAKVTTKNIQNASKATKELNKQIYSFDEITKAGNEKALNLGLEADLKALDDFQSKVKDVRNWLEENKDWLEKVGVTLLTVFGGVKLSQVLGGVSSLVGTAGTGMAVGTGLAGLAGLLVYLASIAVITIAIYGANEVNSILDSITNQSRGLTEQTKQMTEEYRKLYEQGKLTDNQYKTYVNSIKGLIDSNNEEIKSAREKQTWWGELTGANKRYVDQINEAKKRNDLLNQSMKELTGKPYTVQLKTEVETTRFKNFFANVKIYASSLGNAVLGALGLGGLANIKIPTFAGGNVATAPTFGMFGEYADARANPEITTPQNIMYDTVSKALSNNMGNSNVIDKLDELIGVMEQQRIINFNVNGRTVDREMQRVNSDSNFSYNG